MLDTVHNQGLRWALGAFRTSPVSSLNVEVDGPSSWLRREKLSLQYAIRLVCSVCACLDLSVSSSSWGLGRAAVCDCGTPWTFILPFFFAANPSNPAFEVTFPPQFQEYYERKPNAIKSFGLCIAPLLESSNINTKNIQNTLFLIFHPGALLNQLFFSIYTTAKSHFLIHIS